MLTAEQKDKIIAKFKTHKNDTGSSEVQIAILTAEIDELSNHLRQHKKDFSSRRGLLRKVAQRRKLLKYLYKDNNKQYEELIKKLKIKGIKMVSSFADDIDEDIVFGKAVEIEAVDEAAEKEDKI